MCTLKVFNNKRYLFMLSLKVNLLKLNRVLILRLWTIRFTKFAHEGGDTSHYSANLRFFLFLNLNIRSLNICRCGQATDFFHSFCFVSRALILSFGLTPQIEHFFLQITYKFCPLISRYLFAARTIFDINLFSTIYMFFIYLFCYDL